MEEIRQEFADLNKSFWQRGTEEDLEKAKAWDKANPKRRKSQVLEWNELALRYSIRTLRLIKIIENCKPEDRKELGKIIKEEVHEKELLEVFRIAWKNPPDEKKKWDNQEELNIKDKTNFSSNEKIIIQDWQKGKLTIDKMTKIQLQIIKRWCLQAGIY